MKKGKLTWGIQKINIVLHDMAVERGERERVS